MPQTPMFPDRFYTLPQPAKYNKSGRKSKRRPPVDRPADRRPKNDSRPDYFLNSFGVHQKNWLPEWQPAPTAIWLFWTCFWHRLPPVRRCTWGLLLPLVLRWWSQRHYRQRPQFSQPEDWDMVQVWTKTLPKLKALITRERGTLMCILTRSDCRQAIGHHRFLAFSVQMDSFVFIKISCEFLTCICQYFW